MIGQHQHHGPGQEYGTRLGSSLQLCLQKRSYPSSSLFHTGLVPQGVPAPPSHSSRITVVTYDI